MKWKPLADVDLSDAVAYRHVRDRSAGIWYLKPDGTIVHEPVPGHQQTSVHDVEALNDPTRFEKV